MRILLIYSLLLLPSCAQQIRNNEYIIDFSDSVKIVRELLKSDSLTKILDDPEPEQLSFLINNFSPAEIAFESEVLNCTEPVVLCCYKKQYDKKMISTLQQKYLDKKIVLIDSDQFPFLMDDWEVEKYPTIIIVNQRVEIERLEELQAIADQMQV